MLLFPELFHDAFADLDTSLEAERVELLKCDPNYKVFFEAGDCFELSTDLSFMRRELKKWEGEHGFQRYMSYLQEGHRHYTGSINHVLKRNFTSIFSLLRPSFLYAALDLHPFESMYSRTSRYFSTERLRRVFTFASMYMGMSPFKAAGTYSLLQYSELTEGVFYPRGGFHSVISALVRVGERYGVEYRLSTSVVSINVANIGTSKRQQVRQVTLDTGETVSADVVIVNADLVYAYNNLLSPSSTARELSQRTTSCSSISFYWAMDRQIPELTTHNIFLAENYQNSFDDIFERNSIPAQPSFYVHVPSRIDSTAAPENKDALVVLVPIGHLTSLGKDNLASEVSDGPNWNEVVELTRQKVLSTISARTGRNVNDLANAIAHESINTPLSWRSTFNLDRGAILGLSNDFFNVLSFRPKTKHPTMDGLFFVGASTHPGSGVPVCLAGSKITSEQILHSFGMVIPWDNNTQKGPKGSMPSAVSQKAADINQRYLLDLKTMRFYLVIFTLLSASGLWISAYSSAFRRT